MDVKQKFNLGDYTQIFLRRKWFFITPLLIVYISFLVSSYFLPKIYEAKAVMLIEEKKVVNPLLKNLAVSTTVAQRLTALREEILAWPRLFQLVERLGLNKDIKTPLDLERLILDIRRNINLRMKSQDVVTISFRGKDSQNTQELVNTLCDILIKRNLSLQSEDTESAIDFINQQLSIYKKKLDESETALRKFKEVYGLGNLPQVSNTVTTKSTVVTTSDQNVVPMGVTLIQINKELADLEAELVIASVDSTPEHPRIKDLKRRIQSLKEKRNQYIEEVATKAGLDPQSYVNIADSLPRQQEELARLSRDKAINERIYAMLLERLETAKITERLDTSENRTKFRIIEPARLPLLPIKPNRLKLNFLGILLGGVIGFGFVYLLEYTDSSFKNEEELKEYFGYPVLGSISKMVTEEELKHKNRVTWRVITIIFIFIVILTISLIFLNKIGFHF